MCLSANQIPQAWQQGRPDIADHLFTKVPSKETVKNRSNVIEECASIGRGALEAGQYDTAIKWLEIALEELKENLDYHGLNSTNLELQIRHKLGQYCCQKVQDMEMADMP